jgi:2-hydroxy-3-keto-5-methylthiopentenyl-1-phosphate phosphatase
VLITIFALLCDFDGTVVSIRTVEFLLDKFVEGDWILYDSQYRRGEITLEECMQRQISMVHAPKHAMLRELEKVVNFRPNFNKLVEYCRVKAIPFIIVSAGLDFVIRHFLKKKGLGDLTEVYTAKTKFTDNGIKLFLPELMDETSLDFKEDLVKIYKSNGFKVFYIGDGTSDFNAARHADFIFAIRGSELNDLCKREFIPHKEINDFREVIDTLNIQYMRYNKR